MSSGEDLDDSELKIDEGSKIEEPEEAPQAGIVLEFERTVRPRTHDNVQSCEYTGAIWLFLVMVGFSGSH